MRAPQSTAFHVLLIEDDSKDAELYSSLLRDVAPSQVDVMSRARAPFDWIARSNYHLVVIDDPDGGLLLLEQIKRASPATPVIVVSENARVDQAVAAIRMGAEDYLPKPFKMEAFQLAVKRGLDRRVIFGENLPAASMVSLIHTCQMISAALDPKKIFEIVQSFLARELGASYAAVYSLHHDDQPIRLDDAEAKGSDRTLAELLQLSLKGGEVLRSLAKDSKTYRFVERGQLTPGLFVFRFNCAGPDDSFCVLLDPEKPEKPEAMEALASRLEMLRAQIEVTGRNIGQFLGVQHLVYVDDATGLYNTRYLNYVLDREIAQSKKTSKPFAILFIDADRFKTVNDSHGHLNGTKLLHELGHQLKRQVRDHDTVIRYGGDEFVAVLSSCDLKTAERVAERMRNAVEGHAFLQVEGLDLHFTISIGIALFPDHAHSKREIIEAADAAMYISKKERRNTVTVAALGLKQKAPESAPPRSKKKSPRST